MRTYAHRKLITGAPLDAEDLEEVLGPTEEAAYRITAEQLPLTFTSGSDDELVKVYIAATVWTSGALPTTAPVDVSDVWTPMTPVIVIDYEDARNVLISASVQTHRDAGTIAGRGTGGVLLAISVDDNILTHTITGDVDTYDTSPNMEVGLGGILGAVVMETMEFVSAGVHRIRVQARVIADAKEVDATLTSGGKEGDWQKTPKVSVPLYSTFVVEWRK